MPRTSLPKSRVGRASALVGGLSLFSLAGCTGGVHLDPDAWERMPDRFGLGPGREAETRELLASLRRAVATELSERQRRVFEAIVLNEVPLDVLTAELDTNRNAIYKTLFDARRKLRVALVANGYLDP